MITVRRPAWSQRARAAFSRRRLGRAICVAAVVAAVTCVIGAVVAWQLLGDLRDRSAASLQLLQRTLVNVDESLAIAQDVTGTIGDSLDTVRSSMSTVSAGVDDGTAALDSVSQLTQDIPPALDRLDRALSGVHDAAKVVDDALGAIDRLPIGPNIDTGSGLAPAIDGVRDDLRPIADDMRSSTATLHELSKSGGDLSARLGSLTTELDQLDSSLDRSTRLLKRYRSDAKEAMTLAHQSLSDLDRDILFARALAVILAGAIAIGQIAPFHIGRQLAASSIELTPPDEADDDPAA
jgi:methyl-accepting chemotaxis protein